MCPNQSTLQDFVGSTFVSGGTEGGETEGDGTEVGRTEGCETEGVGTVNLARPGSDDVEDDSDLGDMQVSGSKEGTRKFPKFDTDLPIFLRFESYLTSIDGGMKSSKTAREISVDVSKFLRYACGSSCAHPDWRRLTDRDQLVGYVEKLTRAKVGPEGQLSKFDAIICALRFIKAVIIADCSDPMHADCTRTEESIARWKTTLRRQKVRLRVLSSRSW